MSYKLRTVIDKTVNWVLQEKHKQKAHQLRQEVEKAFTEHPKTAGETYLQHLRYTAKMSLHLAFVGGALITHGLFPFLFTRTASKEIENIYLSMRKRASKASTHKNKPLSNILPFRKPAVPPHTLRVSVVGGGFSGTMVVAHLVQTAQFPLSIEWFDEHEAIASGVAYGSSDNVHLLNVRANRMGAFPDKPEGFSEWLQSEEGKAGAAALWPENNITPDSFVPRILYGAYLKSVNEKTFRLAREKSIDIRVT